MMDFQKYQAVQQLITEGKVDDLKKLLIDSIKDMDDASELEKIAVTLREPIIRGHLEAWASSKNLPAAMVDYLTNILRLVPLLPFHTLHTLSLQGFHSLNFGIF